MRNLKFFLPVFLLLICQASVSGQQMPFASYFDEAYGLHPEIPRGLLEAVAWTNTRIRHIDPAQEAPSCMGLPAYHGVMGLIADGKGYFRNSLSAVASLSGYTTKQIATDPRINILAYAKAMSRVRTDLGIRSAAPEAFASVIITLSEFPLSTDPAQDFARQSHLYQVLSFLNDPVQQQQYRFPSYQIDLPAYFGPENYRILSSSHVQIEQHKISDPGGNEFKPSALGVASADYPPAIWDPADPSNWSSRSGTAVSSVTIHTMQGSYAGSISWFKNPAANVSAHYMVRASDGQVTQMVLEADKAWHVGVHNPSAIGLEHEGWISDPAWYTTAMYNSSADIVKDILISGYGISPKSIYDGPPTNGLLVLNGCYDVKGHQHYSSQTHVDPGPYWDWKRYRELIDPATAPVSYTACSGTFYDSGGSSGNYGNYERSFYLIEPAGASQVTLTFSAFDLESNFDFLYIYDGESTDDSLIATLTGTSIPAAVTANSGKMLLEFRSDCATLAAGWAANWSCNTGASACDMPQNLTETGINPFGATLGWSPVAGATGYQLKIKRSIDSVWTWYYTGTNSFEATGLTPDALYTWKVRSICAGGQSPVNGSSFLTQGTSSHTTTTCSGTFRDTGGNMAGYSNNENYTYSIVPAGATSVSVTFTSFDVELNYDYLYIYDGPTTGSPLIGTYTGTSSPGTINSTGGAITFRFTSDGATTNPGWEANWSCNAASPPTTAIQPLQNWYTADFQVNFTDTDNGSGGIASRFWLPLEKISGQWRANATAGFFNEDCDAAGIHTDWTNASGTWASGTGTYRQSDQLNTNSNLYTSLAQDSNSIYLYHWRAKMDGTGANRRSGLHFFCDDATQSNRGTNYLVWFRVDQDKLEIYRNVANTLNLVQTTNVTVDPAIWYDYKVIYNPGTGEVLVYMDEVLLTSWTDPSPLKLGNSISLRNGDSDVEFDDLEVFRMRPGASSLTTVGAAAANYCRQQNSNPADTAFSVRSIVIDQNDSWSAPDTARAKIDWTPPSQIATVNDGTGADTDTTTNGTQLSANWPASTDIHSDIAKYWYSIGTAPGAADIVSWTDNGAATSFTHSGLSLVNGMTYYIAIRAENGAGLIADSTVTDGIYADLTPMGQGIVLKGAIEDGSAFFTVDFMSTESIERFSIEKLGQDLRFISCYSAIPSSNTEQVLLSGANLSGVYRASGVTMSGQQLYSNQVELTDDSGAWLVYPNPADDFIFLQRFSDEPAALKIRDISGREIKSEQLKNPLNPVAVDISDLKSGIYFLEIRMGTKKVTKKLLVY